MMLHLDLEPHLWYND